MATYRTTKTSKAKKTREKAKTTPETPDDDSPIRRKTSDEMKREQREGMGMPDVTTTKDDPVEETGDTKEDANMALYLAKKYWYILLILAYIILKK